MILKNVRIIPTLNNNWICDGCKQPLKKHKSVLEICDDDLVNLLLCKYCIRELGDSLLNCCYLIDEPLGVEDL